MKSVIKVQEDFIDIQIANKRWKEIEKGKYKESSKE